MKDYPDSTYLRRSVVRMGFSPNVHYHSVWLHSKLVLIKKTTKKPKRWMKTVSVSEFNECILYSRQVYTCLFANENLDDYKAIYL